MKKVIKLSSKVTMVLIVLFVYTSIVRMLVSMVIEMGIKSIALLPVWAFIGFLMYVSATNQIVMEERQDYYKVRYAGKLIKVLPAHSKWEAMDKLYSYYINRYPWIKREKLTAVKYGKKFKN